MPSILYLVPTEFARAIYEAAAAAYNARPYADRDAGFDLYCAATQPNLLSGPTMIKQQVVAGYWDSERKMFRAYWMLPRSSISKTPLRLANSVGLIDAGYRGPIMAAVDGVYSVSQNERLFQLAAPDLLPWDEVRVVSEIPGGATARGAGGFGSTGTHSVLQTALVTTAEEVHAVMPSTITTTVHTLQNDFDTPSSRMSAISEDIRSESGSDQRSRSSMDFNSAW